MRKLIYSFIPAIVFTLFFSLNGFAFEAEIIPQKVNPGDVFLLRVNALAKAEFRGKTIKFYQLNATRQIALVAVDIDTPPKKYPVTVRQGDNVQTLQLTVNAHSFKTVNLTLPEGKVSLSRENQKRAVKEAGRLNKLWPVNTPKIWDRGFRAPTDTEISEVFGVKRIMNKKKTSVHRGMDFRGKTGTPVNAINAGTVVLTDDLFYGGNTLIVDHGMGLYSVYMHLSEFKAEKGTQVAKGQIVGLIGSSGRATGPHLHMSVKLNSISVNPESLFELEL